MCRRRCRTIAPPIAIAIALAILAAGFAGAADPATDDKWQFDLALYAWGPTIDGELRFDIPGFDDSFEIEPGQIIDDLQMAGMLGFQARKNRWSAVADVIYMDLDGTKERSVPLRIGSGLQLDVGAGLELEGWVVQAARATSRSTRISACASTAPCRHNCPRGNTRGRESCVAGHDGLRTPLAQRVPGLPAPELR